MATVAEFASPDAAREPHWFWHFLKRELAPYPGRGWLVARMVIAATVTVILIMTFRLPGATLGAFYALTFTRESPRAMLNSGVTLVLGFAAAAFVSIAGAALFLNFPLTHFLWVVASLFMIFFVLRTVVSFQAAISFAFMVSTALTVWDVPTPENARVETTLYTLLGVLLGVAVTVVVEVLFESFHPPNELRLGMELRMRVVAQILAAYADGRKDERLSGEVIDLAKVGTGRLRRFIMRANTGRESDAEYGAEWNTALAGVDRLVDLAAALTHLPVSPSEQDRKRLREVVSELVLIRETLMRGGRPDVVRFETEELPSPGMYVLPEIERTITLISRAFSKEELMSRTELPAAERRQQRRFFISDAFTNPDHVIYALKGTLAATICYVIYSSIAWRGLNTSIATCMVTALSSIGSSRQKQLLRISGAIIGGLVLGLGAQVFILPYLDSIVGFVGLFAAVSAIAAWIYTSTPRLSYMGLQIGLAFYLIMVGEFVPQTSLTIGRDRVMGVLLGLFVMWLVFDTIRPRSAAEEMRDFFIRNMRLLAQLATVLNEQDRNRALANFTSLREQINRGFSELLAASESLSYEFGANRRRALMIGEKISRWQTYAEMIFLSSLAIIQYRMQVPLEAFPEFMRDAHHDFREGMAEAFENVARRIERNPTENVGPKLQELLARLEDAIETYSRSTPQGRLSARAHAILGLARQMTRVTTALTADVWENTPAAEMRSELETRESGQQRDNSGPI